MSTQPAAEPSQPPSRFDPEIVWALHKQKIIIAAVVILVSLLVAGIYYGFQTIQAQKAEAGYAAATSIESWRAVISRFPGSAAAGNCYLRIGAKLRAEGKYPDSDAAYNALIREYPKYPLVVDGYMGLASNAELEKNPEKALDNYKQVTTLFPNSYQAPMALFHQARLTSAKGQLREAQQLFASVVQRYPDSFAASYAQIEAGKIADKLAQNTPKPKAQPENPSSVSPSAALSPSPSAQPQP